MEKDQNRRSIQEVWKPLVLLLIIGSAVFSASISLFFIVDGKWPWGTFWVLYFGCIGCFIIWLVLETKVKSIYEKNEKIVGIIFAIFILVLFAYGFSFVSPAIN